MITDKIANLPKYASVIPGSEEIFRLITSQDFDGDSSSAHNGVEIRHKVYLTKPDNIRRFEVHHHTIDLMVCLHGKEVINLCPGEILTPAEPLKDDGCKMLGAPTGSSIILSEGYFAAIFPEEAHMVAGQSEGCENMVDKLVIKIRL